MNPDRGLAAQLGVLSNLLTEHYEINIRIKKFPRDNGLRILLNEIKQRIDNATDELPLVNGILTEEFSSDWCHVYDAVCSNLVNDLIHLQKQSKVLDKLERDNLTNVV